MSLVAVTGAAGHLGANLVRALIDEGREVRCLVRTDLRAIEGLGVERAVGDLEDVDSLRRAFAGAQTVFHLAANISIAGGMGGLVERANVGGVKNVLDACRAAGVKPLVHFSSVRALAEPAAGVALDEDQPLASGRALSPYERSKVEGERLVLEAVAAGLDAVICTPTAALGPHDYKPSRAGMALVDLWRGRLPALLGGGFDWVDARDVAKGALAAEKKGTAGRRYLLCGAWRSVAQLAELVHQNGGRPPPRIVVPLALAAAVAPLGLAGSRLLGSTPVFTPEAIRSLRGMRQIHPRRSIAELGWAPRPIEVTVADTLAWFRNYGSLA